MIRVISFLIVAGVIAFGFVWLADRPGEVAITWLGLRIETSVMVAAVTVALIAVAAVLLWLIVWTIWRSPGRLRRAARNRRSRKGYQAISRGLIAIGSGDARAAQRLAGEAQRLTPSEPLALLLRAQSAQLQGDRPAAEAAFRAMAARPDTRLIGLRGLYVEARRRDDTTAARYFADEAAKSAPALPWAAQAVLEFRCAEGDWENALKVLERNARNGLVDKQTYRRHRAVLMTARAIALEESDRETARSLCLEALKLAPDLIPAAALVGRLLSDAGEVRKAGRILETEWRLNPHPDLAEVYAHLRIADSARDRLARIEALVQNPPGHVEGRLALARAGLDAREFATARAAVEPLLAEPTQRVCTLMAELEEVEHGDVGRAREWMARALRAARDPAWTADGIVSDRWLPISPVSGRIDAFQWRVPPAELTGPAPVIVHAAAVPAPTRSALQPPAPAASAEPAASPPPETKPAEPAEPAAVPRPAIAQSAAERPAQRTPIIPLVTVPDDPGPDTDAEAAAEPEPRPAGRGLGFGRLFR
jgi:HemY protein